MGTGLKSLKNSKLGVSHGSREDAVSFLCAIWPCYFSAVNVHMKLVFPNFYYII